MATLEQKKTKRQRVGEVMDLLGAGVPYTEIQKQIAARHDITERAVARYISDARKMLPALYEYGERKFAVCEAILKAQRHYIRCVKDSQHGPGLATLKWLSELQGVAPAQKLELGGEVTVNRGPLDAEQVDKIRMIYGLPALLSGDQESEQEEAIEEPVED